MTNSVERLLTVEYVEVLRNVDGVNLLNNASVEILVDLNVLKIVSMVGCSILLNVKIMSNQENSKIGLKMLLESKMQK